MIYKKPTRTISRVFIHCSAASRSTVTAAEIDSWHKQRGWNGIGYHYFIRTCGLLEFGRDVNKTPAAQRGHNRGTLAICVNGLEGTDFTLEQFDTLKGLCGLIIEDHKDVTFHGHCEVSNKACPVFDYKKILLLDKYGKSSL